MRFPEMSQIMRKMCWHIWVRASYCPPNQDMAIFLAVLQATLQKVSVPGGHFMGDFNACHSDWYTQDPITPAGHLLLGLIDEEGLIRVVHGQPTHFSLCGKSSSLLDHLASTQQHRVQNITVLLPVSDHPPVVADVTYSSS